MRNDSLNKYIQQFYSFNLNCNLIAHDYSEFSTIIKRFTILIKRVLNI